MIEFSLMPNIHVQCNTRFVRYLISGAASTTANLGLTWVLERVGMHYIAVVTVAFTSSVIVSFVLQKFFTFGNKSSQERIRNLRYCGSRWRQFGSQ